jgi:hypothetical protein
MVYASGVGFTKETFSPMTFSFVTLYIGGALLILFVGGLLVRTDICRAAAKGRRVSYPRSQLLEDLRAVQATTIEFIAQTPRSRELMQVLANSGEPIPLGRLFGSTSAVETSWTALFIISVTGLLRFSRRGVTLTSVGHEVLARINGANARRLKAAELAIGRLDAAGVAFQPEAPLAKVA